MEENIITIRNKSQEAALSAFQGLMSLTETHMNELAREQPSVYQGATPRDIEFLTLQALREVAPQTPFHASHIQLNKAQAFPDLLAEQYYGVEVKSTKEDHWTSTGSSIIETTRSPLVDHIYMMFGKLGGERPEFRCRPYEECMSNIAVTHSPRYLIDMRLAPTETIFAKMGISYDELRTSPGAISLVRKYYRNKSQQSQRKEMPWWIGDGEEGVTNLVVRLWSDISPEERANLRRQIFILFPEVLTSAYQTAALWLCTRHSILLYNARDTFSAGGVCTSVLGSPLEYRIPHIIGELITELPHIHAELTSPSSYLVQEIEAQAPKLFAGSSIWESWLAEVERLLGQLQRKGKLNTAFQLDRFIAPRN